MRFLLDEIQSPAMAELLARHGHDVVHVRDVGLAQSPDAAILAAGRDDNRVVVSGDTDFGDLLSSTNATSRSVVLLRRQGQRRAAEVVALLLANLEAVSADLKTGAIVVLDADRVRVRRLPLRPI